MDEVHRIKEVYEKRRLSKVNSLYNYFRPGYFYEMSRREQQIISLLNNNNNTDLSKKNILDLGCGKGDVLRDFMRYGASPENCFGIDLVPENIKQAERLYPNMQLLCSNAEILSYDDELFDIIICFTVFSSILDKTMKRNICKEMCRVLKPNGLILWYDYFLNNPRNPDVRGIKKKEINELFPDCRILLKRITLAPPLARMIAPYSYLACYLLENLKVLNTHYIGLIQKPLANISR